MVDGGMGGGEMVRFLNDARVSHIHDWEVRLIPNGIFIDYQIVVVFRRRRKDGSLGKRRSIWYSDRFNNITSALVRACRAVLAEVPEVPV